MAFYFTPPTYEQTFMPERDGVFNLMRFYSYPSSKTVLIESGVANEYVTPETDRVAAASAVFDNGGEYEVTEAQKTILEAAGYTVEER